MISICIPTYNTDCRQLLKELSSQTQSLDVEYEVIVADDHSKKHHNLNEATCNKIGFTYLKSKKNIGRVATRIKLAKKSKYKYLLFIDADMIPRSESFLKKYQECIFSRNKVTFGGYAYGQNESKKHLLRYKYGVKREEIESRFRVKKPFKHIYSGNVLIAKEFFFKTNHIDKNRYGLDYAFSVSLKKLGVIPVHIDNETYHMGIESNIAFLEKTKEGSKTMFWLYKTNQVSEYDNKLIYTYKKIERWYLLGFFKFMGGWLINPVERRLAKNKAPMFFFDFYRLYYFTLG